MPRDTKYREALSLDVEAATAFMQSEDWGDDTPERRPAMSEFDLHAELLTDVANQVRLLRSEQISLKTGKASKIDFLQGPKTAAEEASYKHRKNAHYSLAARLLPHKAEQLLAQIEE